MKDYKIGSYTIKQRNRVADFEVFNAEGFYVHSCRNRYDLLKFCHDNGEISQAPEPELKEELAQLVDYYRNSYGESALITLRAIINGKLSKRKITPEQQAKMQAARQKVI